jgi:hypothetical protein
MVAKLHWFRSFELLRRGVAILFSVWNEEVLVQSLVVGIAVKRTINSFAKYMTRSLDIILYNNMYTLVSDSPFEVEINTISQNVVHYYNYNVRRDSGNN